MKLTRLIPGSLVILGALVIHGMSMSPGIASWGSSEVVLAASAVGNLHQQGPFLILLVRVLEILGVGSHPFFGPHAISAMFIAVGAAGVYGTTRLLVLQLFRPGPISGAISATAMISGMCSALVFILSDSVWTAGIILDRMAPMGTIAVLVVYLLVRGGHSSPVSLRHLTAAWFFTGLAVGISSALVVLIVPVLFASAMGIGRNPAGSWGRDLGLAVLGAAVVYVILNHGIPGYLRIWSGSTPAVWPLLGFLLVLLLVLGIGALVSDKEGPAVLPPLVLAGSVLFFLGYSVVLILPIRSMQGPIWDHESPASSEAMARVLERTAIPGVPEGSERYGSVISVAGADREEPSFRDVVSGMYLRYFLWNTVGRHYSGEVAGPGSGDKESLSISDKEGRGKRAFPNRYHGIPLGLAILGSLVLLGRTRRKEGSLLVVAWLFLGPVLFLLVRFPAVLPMELDGFVIPSLAISAMWIGIAAGSFVLLFPERLRSRPLVVIYPVMALAVPVLLWMENADDHQRRGNMVLEDAAYNCLQSCDSNAVLFTQGDNDTYPVLVLQQRYGIRPDVDVVNINLLGEPWYAAQVARRRLALLGSEDAIAMSQVEELVAHPERQNEVLTATTAPEFLRLPVPREIAVRYARRAFGSTGETTRLLQAGMLPVRDLVWTLPVPEALEEDSLAQVTRFRLDLHEVMIQSIIRHCGWRRPVHFTKEVPPDAYRGLEKNCLREGMTIRLTPLSASVHCPIAPVVTRAMLFHFSDVPEQQPSPRQLRRSSLPDCWYLDPGTFDVVKRNRNDYLVYANCMIQTAQYSGAHLAIQLQARMYPGRFYPMDYRGLYDIAVLYFKAGYQERYAEYARRVRDACHASLRRTPRQGLAIDSPYHYLLELALLERNTEEALRVLATLEREYPQARDIHRKRQELQGAVPSSKRSNS